MKNLLGDNEIPIGFGMALAKDLDAMNYFSNLEESKKDQIIEQSRQIQSKSQMEQYVSSLKNDSFH